MVLDIL